MRKRAKIAGKGKSYGGLYERGYFCMGPDQPEDLRVLRPYFLVPLDPVELSPTATPSATSLPHPAQEALDRIVKQVNAPEAPPLTDVYVISHGWHRTFYTAVSGYDRLMSRFSVLRRRGRIETEPGLPYHPLFLAIHWHSDPGPENHYDPDGRRHKDNFLQNAELLFVPDDPGANFTNDFEDLFEFLSCVASPGGPTALDQSFDENAFELAQVLKRYRIRDAINDNPRPDDASFPLDPALVSLVWRCYNESSPKGLLLDQDAPPGTFMDLKRAINLLLTFVISALGPLLILGWLKSWRPPFIVTPLQKIGDAIYYAVKPQVQAVLPPVLKIGWLTHYLSSTVGVLLVYIPLWALCALYLWVAQYRRSQECEGPWHVRKESGNVLLNVLTWIVVQLPLALLLVGFALTTYVAGWFLKGFLVWNEREGAPDENLPLRDNHIPASFREELLALVRWPLWWLMRTSATDSPVYRLTVAIDQQLSVVEMQRRGTETGGRLALFLDQLYDRCPQLVDSRLHMVGHSFGAVAVSNGARRLVLAENPGFISRFPPDRFPFYTICVIQGAMASAWYSMETRLRSQIRFLAAIYTRYDTATGFFYSVGYNARLGVGNVGLFVEGDPIPVYGHNGEFATLTAPPTLDPPPIPQPPVGNCKVNLDASRFEYQGPPTAGGAHSDIFKDDLVCLLWTTFTTPV